jgi:hypothetical protein
MDEAHETGLIGGVEKREIRIVGVSTQRYVNRNRNSQSGG